MPIPKRLHQSMYEASPHSSSEGLLPKLLLALMSANLYSIFHLFSHWAWSSCPSPSHSTFTFSPSFLHTTPVFPLHTSQPFTGLISLLLVYVFTCNDFPILIWELVYFNACSCSILSKCIAYIPYWSFFHSPWRIGHASCLGILHRNQIGVD